MTHKQELIAIMDSVLDDRNLERAINLLRPIASQLSADKTGTNLAMSGLLQKLRKSSSTTIQASESQNKKTFKFTSEDFEAPKSPPQSAPPADFEIKAQVKEAINPSGKEILAMYDLDKEGALAKYETVENFMQAAKELGCKFKKGDAKSMDEAWNSFEKFFRETINA